MQGPGAARYTLDDDGLVHLDYKPRWGKEQHLVGALPRLPEPRRPRAVLVLIFAIAVWVVPMAVGFAIDGFVGLAIGVVATAFVLLGLQVAGFTVFSRRKPGHRDS